MKSTLWIFLLSLSFLAAKNIAQSTHSSLSHTPLIEWGKVHKISPFSQFFAEDTQYLYAYKLDFPNFLQQVQIILLDKNELALQELTLALPKNKGQNFSFLKMMKIGNELALFCQRFEEGSKVVELWVQRFSLEGKPIETALALDRLPLIHPKDRSTYYQFGQTPKGEIMLANAISLKIEEQPGFFIKIFDKNFKKQKEHFIALPEQKIEVMLDKMVLDKKGNSYLLAYEMQHLPNFGGQMLPEVYKLFFVSADSKVKEYHLDIQKKYLAATEMLLQPQNGQVLLTGFYANDKMTQFAGLFLMQMNEQGGIEKAHFTKIPPSFFAADNKNNAHKNLQNYSLEGVFMQNGNLHLLAQQKLVEAVNRVSSFEVSYIQDVYYHFLNLGYFILNPEGELIASYKIPKRQVTMNDHGQFSSFIPLKRERANAQWVSFLYLDHPKNKNSFQNLKIMSSPESAVWVESSALESGRLQKKVLSPLSEKAYILPQVHYQSQNNLYLLGYSKEGLQVGRLALDAL